MGFVFLVFVLLTVLSVVAIIGHGIWVLVSLVLQALFGGPTARPVMLELCQRCGTPTEGLQGSGGCGFCGWSLTPWLSVERLRPDLALAQLRRRVERFGAIGLLAPEIHDRLLRAIQGEEKLVATRAAAAAPVRAPVTRTTEPIPPLGPTVAATSLPPQAATKPHPDAAERARAFREFQERTAEQPEVATASHATPDRSHRVFDLLAAFLEEKSIRWGELVGGLLIVGCSLALVISFWASIAERPWIKYVLLNGVTAALFGLGVHAERRWKLPTTALGLLIIATLLTPLNFLAVASLVGETTVSAAWSMLGEVMAVAIFAALVFRAGRSLVAGAPWTLLVGVVLPSASMLLLSRSVGPGRVVGSALLLGSLPWLAHASAVGGWMTRFRREPAIGEAKAVELLRLLGLATFAAAVALGLVIAHAWPVGGLARLLSPLGPLVGASILAPGLLLWRRVEARELAGYRTAGTAIAASGTLILLASVALAWPTPARLVPVALLDFVVLTAIALGFRVFAAHVLGGICLALVLLLGWAVAAGRLDWQGGSSSQVAAVLLSAWSGAVLVPMALVCGVGAAVGAKVGRRLDAQAYALVGALAGVVSLGLVTWHGFGRPGDPTGATGVYAAFALAAPAFAIWFAWCPLVEGTTGRAEARGLGWVGSVLLLAALVQGLVHGGLPVEPRLPWVVACLAHATITSVGGWLLGRWGGDRHRDRGPGSEEFAPVHPGGIPGGGILASICDQSALAATNLAGAGLILAILIGGAASLAVDGLWLSLILLALAGRFGSARLFAAAQGALTWAVIFGVAATVERRPWFVQASLPWLDPRMIQAQGVALGLLCLGFIGARLVVRRRSKSLLAIGELLDPPGPSFDRYLRGAVVALMVALAVYAVVPGAAQELTPRDVATRLAGAAPAARVVPPITAFEIPGIAHRPASGGGSWALWGVTLAVLLAGQWERFRRLDLLGTLVVATLAAPLVAAGLGESIVAVASVYRWSGAILLFASSTLIWDRDRLGRWALGVGWRLEPDRVRGLHHLAVAAVLGLALFPLVAMGLYVASAAVLGRPLAGNLGEAWMVSGILFITASLISLGLSKTGGEVPNWVRPLLAVLGTLPVLVVTTYLVAAALVGNPMVGTEPGSFFRRFGQAGSFVPPILLMAVTLVGFAVRERSSGFAFAAGLAWNVTATVGYLTLATRAGLRLDAALAVRLAQLNAVVAALTTLGWVACLVVDRRRKGRPEDPPVDGLLMASSLLGVALNLLVLVAGTVVLFLDPVPAPIHDVIAGPLGFLALGLAAGAVVARSRVVGRPVHLNWVGFGLVCLADFGALVLTGRDRGNWFAFHGVLIGQAMVALALPLLAWRDAQVRLAVVADPVRAAVVRWSGVAMALVILFALRGYWSDPQSPWWTVVGLGLMAGLAAALAAWAARPGFLRVAAVLANLAATGWYCGRSGWWSASDWPLVDVWLINIVALAVPVPLWRAIEHRLPRSATQRTVPFAGRVAWGALVVLSGVVLIRLGEDASGGTGQPLAILGWGAVAAMAVAIGSGLWDARSRGAVAGLYLLGLVAAGWTVGQFTIPVRWLVWTGTMVLAAYAVGTSFLWSRRAALRALADRWRFPHLDADDPVANLAWLVPANLALAGGVLVLAGETILTDPEIPIRSASAHAALAAALAVGLLARGARRSALQQITLAVVVVGVVAWAWAWVEPDSNLAARYVVRTTRFLDRTAGFLAAVVGALIVYGLGLGKFLRLENDWTLAARRTIPTLLVLMSATVFVLFLEEASGHNRPPVPISTPALAVVVAALVGAGLAALVAAVVPGRDPLGLSERGRTAYVYGAEAIVGLLGAHIRLTLPWLFSGWLIHYWPLLLMGVAFAGVGLSEVFRRQNRLVLAEPLERTGAFLPLLPVLAVLWQVPLPGEDVVYLVLVSFLYTTLALTRSSLGFGALATLAGNGAFWSWLGHQDQLNLLAHPQLWVIPPALSVLVGAYLNRDRLTLAQLAGTRHGAALAIYLASTADIVLTGVARAPWLPVVLAALSMAGIFAGILLRVRGFLFLGLGFLSLALFSIIWYAAVDLHQTWLWAASGVVTGILILVIFAVFEKKRQDVLAVVGQLKEWSP